MLVGALTGNGARVMVTDITSDGMSDGLGVAVWPLHLSLQAFSLFTLIYLCTWGGQFTRAATYKIAWAEALVVWILLRYLLRVPSGPAPPEDAAKAPTSLSDAIPLRDGNAVSRWDFISNLERCVTPARDTPGAAK